MHRSRAFAVGLLLLLPCGIVGAAESSESADDSATPDSYSEYIEVNVEFLPKSNTIVTKLPVPLHETPANVGVVSRPLLLEQGAGVLSDALRNISGINIQPSSGVHDFFFIRGFDSLNGGLILTDGAAEPEATFYSMYNIEGVEVLKGPGGFLYGANPLAGTVNMARKQPLPGNFTMFDGAIGSQNTTEGAVDWNLSNEEGRASFRLNAFWKESDNYRDDKESEHYGINPAFAFRVGDDTRINVNLEYVDAAFSPDSGLPLVDNAMPEGVPRTRSYQSPFDFSDQQIQRAQVDVERKISDRLTLRNKTYYRDLEWNTAGTLLAGVSPSLMTGRMEVNRTLTLLDDQQTFIGNQFEVVLEATTGAVTHQILAGVEIARQTDEFDLDVVLPDIPAIPGFPEFGIPGFPGVPGFPAIDLLDPVETATVANLTAAPSPGISGGDATSEIIAPYVIDQIKLNEQVQLFVGGRYDHIDFNDDRRVETSFDQMVSEISRVSRDDSKFSPMAGVVIQPDSSLSLYANGSKSFAPASPRVSGERKPEESEQFELGAKKRFRSCDLVTTFAVYQLDRENIAIPDDNGITQQAGDQRSRGFEFELAAEPIRGLRTIFSYSYNDAELTRFTEQVTEFSLDPMTFTPVFLTSTVDRTGNHPIFAPKHLLNLWVSRTLRGGLGIAGGARYVDSQYIAEDNLFEIDSALILDAGVFYDFKDWRLKVNLKNLTDEEYETRGFGSTSVIPASDLAIHAGFETRL